MSYNNSSLYGYFEEEKLSCERLFCRSSSIILHFRNLKGGTVLASNLNCIILKKYLIRNIEVPIRFNSSLCHEEIAMRAANHMHSIFHACDLHSYLSDSSQVANK